jgi:hypothetical protein
MTPLLLRLEIKKKTTRKYVPAINGRRGAKINTYIYLFLFSLSWPALIIADYNAQLERKR